MKLFSLLSRLIAGALLACASLPGQPANSAPWGSTVLVWSSHTTVRERVDAGVHERIELWSRTWIVSPSGIIYANTDHYGRGGAEGSSTTAVSLNETGRWSYWSADGGALDSLAFGDGPNPWYMFPHNPPNGAGYGGAGTVLGSFIDVSVAPPVNRTLTTSVIGRGTVSGGGSYADGGEATVSAAPADGHAFSGWQGAVTGQANPTTVTMDSDKSVTAVFVATNTPPTVTWTITPGSVASGQSYTVAAHGRDAEGNLAQVTIWKNGAAFAQAGGGTGFESEASQATSDTGPATITFTASAVDASGASAATIAQTVSVAATATAPTIAWNTTPGTVASGQSYHVSAHGHDRDGNLAQVNVWKNGVGFAFAGGGDGTDHDSGNPTSDTGPATITFTANSVDAGGLTSATISQIVTVAAPATVSATLRATPTLTTAPGATTLEWSSAEATAVAVTGPGLASTAPSGSQAVSGLAPGVHTFSLTAQGPGGPVTQSVTVTVTTTPGVSASITASPTTVPAPGTTTIAWASAQATAVAVEGAGVSSSALHGTQTVSGLAPGSYDYVITAQGPNGPAIQTATVLVTTPVVVAGAITVSPTSATAPAAATVSWTTAHATSVAVSGPGLNRGESAGSQTVSGLGVGTHTYTLTAQGPGGPFTQTATFAVSPSGPTVTGSLSASPTTATAPGATTLTWNTSGATSVLVTGPGLASTSASGTQTVTGLSAGTHTFTLTAQGYGGPITRTATVTVASGASVTGSISVAPSTMAWGGTAAVTWTTTNATAVSVSGPSITGTPFEHNANLTVNIGGLSPGETTWTLIAEGPNGPIIRTATIRVTTGDGLYGSLTASPTVIYSHQSATLAWTTTGANFRAVHGYWPGLNGVDIFPASATGSTVVAGLAPGDYRFTLEYGPDSSATRIAFADLRVLGVNRTVTTSASPPGAGVVGGAGTYAEGSSVTLTAQPGATYVFTGWSGDLTGPANPLTFTVGPQNYAVVAHFAPRTYAVTATVSPAGAGSVSGAGDYPAGATATLVATPNALHAFTGWTGDLVSAANPLSWTVNGAVRVTANFSPTSFALTTAATTGGSVTPGGEYPPGSLVTVRATPDATHRFTAWSGDANGPANPLGVTLDRAKFVQANFAEKLAQTIAFDPPGDQALNAPPFLLNATATSGLPVTLSLLSGPALLTGNTVAITGPGPVTLQANQPGDALYLPAPPVNRTFNVIAAATLKYRGEARTLLRDGTTRAAPPYVLEKP